jgi:arabinogalactan oligomer/maltooligosaccharide transport system substrate-binding protein
MPALEGELTMWQTYGSGAGTEGDALYQSLDMIAGTVDGGPNGMHTNANAENPNLTVHVVEVNFGDLFNTYQLQAASGAPDLFVAPNDSLGDLARAGVSQDLSSYFTADELARFSDLAVSGSELDGVLYQVPESLKAVAMYYNKDVVTTPPATVQDLLTAAQAGTKIGLLGGTNIYHNFGWWGAFGGQLMDSTGKCIADQGTGVSDAFAFLKNLEDAGVTFYANYDDMAAAFKAGDVDIIVDGPWAAGGYVASVANLGVAPMPAGPVGPALPLTGVDGWTINPNSAVKDLAVDFAKRMVQPDILSLFANIAYHIPADPSVASTDPIALQFAAAVESGLPRPQVPQLGAFWGNFGNALSQVLDAGVDPTQAVADACSAMNQANGF